MNYTVLMSILKKATLKCYYCIDITSAQLDLASFPKAHPHPNHHFHLCYVT